VAKRHLGDRHPGRRRRIAYLEAATGLLSEIDAVAGIAVGCRREMLAATPDMRIRRLCLVLVVREAAAGQNHASPGGDAVLDAGLANNGSNNPAVLADEPARRRLGMDRDAEIEGSPGQPRDQRIAARHLYSAPMD